MLKLKHPKNLDFENMSRFDLNTTMQQGELVLQLVKEQHVHDTGCGVDHIMRVAYYGLY